MSKCKYRHEEYCAYIDQYCVEGPCPYEEPQTNADRIRAMSDEELAEFFKSPLFFNKPWCCLHEKPCRHLDRKEFLCAECLLEWLKQEVTEHSTT